MNLKANKITVNREKSHVLIIQPKSTHRLPKVKVYVYQSPLQVKDSVMYSGVTIDLRQNFDDHITKFQNRAVKISVGAYW